MALSHISFPLYPVDWKHIDIGDTYPLSKIAENTDSFVYDQQLRWFSKNQISQNGSSQNVPLIISRLDTC